MLLEDIFLFGHWNNFWWDGYNDDSQYMDDKTED
jgi:hypothetical protein